MEWSIRRVCRQSDYCVSRLGSRVCVVQNIHLVAKWLPTLEKKIEQYSLDSHPKYRVYMSAEPAGSRESHCIPQGILEVSIKITNEPPTGMMANLHKALDNFTQVILLVLLVLLNGDQQQHTQDVSQWGSTIPSL